MRLHTVFQNIKCLSHFGVHWRVFFNIFVPVRNINVYCLVVLALAWQISKSVSVAATEMSSSMDIHSSYSSFSMPLGGSKLISDSRNLLRDAFLDVSLQMEREIPQMSTVNTGYK
ncbi:hypothetical protein AVEN_173363-1 [Araneus ventricosus]|uniref:Uncharacterized protein n=1 Tax=Araneus ventricosus TaxID=182803 RepID=A0A4Y2L306_ARAVE|nr:hypothetical protein AVEN_30029-1 [Araneus ventricosus]GBN08187.1 hypothetical protein AVEN_108722-1 [Araneus ventricosus]GBN08211.1 hypothetical protein AVEN_149577-1 [Araneus ventricosus]GBN08223.1 hypothetical protein AVEN_173363-1 [Araneus ventricosus]